MKQEYFIEILKHICVDLYGDINNTTLTKTLTFYFLKRFFQNYLNCQDDYDNDIINSICDSKYDRGLDAIFIEDSQEDKIFFYLIQTKFSNMSDYIINEKDVSQYLLSFREFPNIKGIKNSAINNAIDRYNDLLKEGMSVQKIGIFISLAEINDNAKILLEEDNIEIYEYDRINSEILLDEFLPDITITLKNNPSYYNKESFLGILDVQSFVKDVFIKKYIEDESLFAYNVRGLMNARSSSISYDIKDTCMKKPKELFEKNNGITIVCEDFKEDENNFLLKRASVVNGQQTIRAIHRISNNLNCKNDYYVPVKVLKLRGKDEAEIKEEILEIAKSTNRQNTIKASDLKANDFEQKDLKEMAQKLPKPLQFNYLNKRTFNCSKNLNAITKEQGALFVSAFLNQYPNDREEALFKNNYDKIFKDLKAQHIAIIDLFKKYIENNQRENDENNPDKFWSNKIYIKFKMRRVINYCLYLLSLIMSECYNLNNAEKRKKFIEKIYKKMICTNNYDIQSYFTNDFWDLYKKVSMRYINKLYNNKLITADYMRKSIDNNMDFNDIYEEVRYEMADEKRINIDIKF